MKSETYGSDLYLCWEELSVLLMSWLASLSFRTETVVEKMLTNWMSICLYSFLKVTVSLALSHCLSHLTRSLTTSQ